MAVKKAKPVVEDSDKRKKKQNYPVQRNVLPPEDFSKFDLLPEKTCWGEQSSFVLFSSCGR